MSSNLNPARRVTASRCARTVALLLAAGCLAPAVHGGPAPAADPSGTRAPRPPRLSPDYADLVVPPNIAPLNFVIEEPGTRYRARLSGPAGSAVEILGKSAAMRIPLQSWASLLRANAGGYVRLEIAVRDQGGRWQEFAPVTNRVALEEIDGYLVYRRLRPLFNLYRTMGIYQRDLGAFEEKAVLENTSFGRGCVNCHTFLGNDPGNMALNIRSPASGNPMLLVRSNEVAKVAMTAGYLSWHPSGRLLAFSANRLSLFFHTRGEARDVFDANSDLGIYRVDSNAVVRPPVIARPDRLETWPAWTPDGRALFFSSAPMLAPMERRRFREVRYDLVRVAYDIGQDLWGEPETVVSAAQTGRSAVQPRVSPDGRFVVYGLCAYGHFPIYQPDSDLHLLDLGTGEPRRLEINSDAADAWHSWSANSRWLVFSSKRRDGLFARPYFAYVDAAGRFSKPFLLPQEDPTYFDSCLQTLNVPELVQRPVAVAPADLARAATKPRRVLTPQTVALTPAGAPAPVSEYEDAHTESKEAGPEEGGAADHREP